jgi:hypothetical protein
VATRWMCLPRGKARLKKTGSGAESDIPGALAGSAVRTEDFRPSRIWDLPGRVTWAGKAFGSPPGGQAEEG